MKILLVAGARPNFMKIAPLVRKFRESGGGVKCKIVHTGQHYDYEMSKVFFEELDIPEPDSFLGAGSGTHAEQTAKVMIEFEKVCLIEKPDAVVVVGDVNSTVACSVTAKKLLMKVAHVEAGLRSGDRSMPEEINRIVTDSISDYLFVTENSGLENLKREGKQEDQIFFVGNTMIDTLINSLEKLKTVTHQKESESKAGESKKSDYAVITLHRPSNVDDKEKLRDILLALNAISDELETFFPIHPRTEKNIKVFGLTGLIDNSHIHISPPKSYMEFLSLWKDATLVMTDSGGLQEETTALGIPCFTIRDNTERPITIEEGTNVLVGTTRDKILKEFNKFKNGNRKLGRRPELWDGKAADRIVRVLLESN
jgi:UDP-N-acetylglucosamine 2-epimerase (non-hydrolysing)